MKEIILHGKFGSGKTTLVDDKDYPYLNQFSWHLQESGYVVRTIHKGMMRTKIRMHRELMNPPENLYVDHTNGNRLDNQRSNLRLATNQQNQFNAKIASNNTSGVRGVYRMDGRWRAYLKLRGKEVHLGMFNTKDEARDARIEAIKRIHREFANLKIYEDDKQKAELDNPLRDDSKPWK